MVDFGESNLNQDVALKTALGKSTDLWFAWAISGVSVLKWISTPPSQKNNQ
ncbi:hypothetical protein [Methyloglobulus sp.]|uniref:hypothetical protein n=1 Tax=Methyloglobulus sp. TaxID=2518622 RepID=UPI0032B87912